MSLFWHVTHNRIFTDMDEHLRKSCRTSSYCEQNPMLILLLEETSVSTCYATESMN